ncbi:MAG: sulfatase-like hydrolase/transferase [Thermoanaerobaculia bacterium]
MKNAERRTQNVEVRKGGWVSSFYVLRSAFCVQILLTGLAASCLACAGPDVPPIRKRTPIILISIDTLRADRLPAYGYGGVATPALDAFRRDAVLFERAFSHVPLTLPSHATMFTGMLPSHHGVRDNLGFALREEVPTVAEVLGRNGYATGAAVSAYVLRRESGIARGFDFFDDQVDLDPDALVLGSFQRDGGRTIEAARTWLDAREDGPLFFFLHLYEPHTPWSAPEPWRSRYADPYDAEVAAADALAGAFLDLLRARGLYDDALVIVTSDHGEGLGDHGETEHGILLYREAIHVPLLVKFPRSARAGETVRRTVGLADLAPTILEVAGAAVPEGLDGISLMRNVPARPIYSETFYPRLHFGWSDLHSLIEGDLHYIEGPDAELYDLATDPGERTNLREERRRDAFAMRERIAPRVVPAMPAAGIDPEEAEKLAALGYLGSAPSAAAAGPLPDPKSRLASMDELKRAFALAEEERFAEALPLLRKLEAENPLMLDVIDLESTALARTGDPHGAIAAARRAVRLSPRTTHLQLLIASLSLDIGEVEAAQRHAELALEDEPAQAREILARAALELGREDEAERHAAALLADERFRIAGSLTMARVRLQQQRTDDALALLDDAGKEIARRGRPAPQGLHFLRGDALARAGRGREAEREFLREIELFPREPQAYKNLALLYLTVGDDRKASETIFRLERAAPTPRSYLAIVQLLRTLGDARGAAAWADRGLERWPGHAELARVRR